MRRRLLAGGVPLLLLPLVGLAAVQSSRPAADDLPPFRLRARIVKWGENAPDKQKFQFRLAGVKAVATAAGQEWSEWLTVGAAEYRTLLGDYPNNYLRRFPVVIKFQVSPVRQPMVVEIEAVWQDGRPALQGRAELFGPTVGINLAPDNQNQFQLQLHADYNRRYWQVLKELDAQPIVPKQFPIIDRFIGGDQDRRTWQDGLRYLSRAGFSVLMVPPHPTIREMLNDLGMRRTSWAVYNPPGYAFAFDPKVTPEAIDRWAGQQAEAYTKAGFRKEDMALFVMSDEPGWYYPAMFRIVREHPENRKRFHQYLKDQGLTPEMLGAQSWEEVLPVGRSQAKDLPKKRLFYWTMRFYSWESARHFAECTRALERAFYPDLPVVTNWNFFSGRFYVPGPVANNADKDSPDAAMGGHDWFEFARLRGGTMLWTEDWFSDRQAYQWSFYAAKLRSAARLGNVRFGGYVIPRTAGDRPDGILQKILCLVGHGGKAVKYFVFGPEYNFPGNCYSEKATLLAKMAEAHRMIAQAEAHLWPGQPLRSPVAIFMPRSSFIWDAKDIPIPRMISDATNSDLNRATVDYLAEVFDIYLALQHANIPVDFVDEDALVRGELEGIKVLYVTAPNLPREGIPQLLTWVRRGGVLATISNAVTADRYDEPLDELGRATGIHEEPRPRLLVGHANKLEAVAALDLPDRPSVYGVRGKLSAGDYEVLARFADGSTAAVSKTYGQGRHVHYAFLPGISYWRSRKGTNDGLPVDFAAPLRQLIAEPVRQSGYVPPVQVSVAMVETPVLIHEQGAAITLLNWSGSPVAELGMQVRLGFVPRVVRSVRHGRIDFRREADGISLSIPLAAADILLLEK